MPLYLIIKNGEIQQVVEYETAERARRYMEHEDITDAILAIVVGRQDMEEVMRHVTPKKGRKK